MLFWYAELDGHKEPRIRWGREREVSGASSCNVAFHHHLSVNERRGYCCVVVTQISMSVWTPRAVHSCVATLKVATDVDVTPATSWNKNLGSAGPPVGFTVTSSN